KWLKENIPKYHEAQKNNTVSRFHASCHSKFLDKFPMRKECFPEKPEVEPLTKDEEAELDKRVADRKKQLVSWYEWNGNPLRRAETRDAALFLKALGLLQQKAEQDGQRAPQRIEMYQRLYREKIKQAVDARAAEEGATTQKQILKIRRALTKDMLDAEPPEVHAHIDSGIKKWKEDREKSAEQANEEEVRVPTAEEYQSAVLALPSVMNLALKAMSDATGWVIYAVAAGPHGSDNGNVWMQDFYVGPKNSAGHTFREAHANFDKGFHQPFSEHVYNCFPPDVRAARVVQNAIVEQEEQQAGVRIPEPIRIPESSMSPNVSTAPKEVEATVSPGIEPTANADGVHIPIDDVAASTNGSCDPAVVDNGIGSEDDDDDPLAALVAAAQPQNRDGPERTQDPAARPGRSILGHTPRSESGGVSGNMLSVQHGPVNDESSIRDAVPDLGGLERPTAPPFQLTPPANGAPSEPIEFAFARANEDLLDYATGAPTSVSNATEVGAPAVERIPNGSIDPILLGAQGIPRNPIFLASSVCDYTISGAQMAVAEVTVASRTLGNDSPSGNDAESEVATGNGHEMVQYEREQLFFEHIFIEYFRPLSSRMSAAPRSAKR
ncbi:hypothetical protein CVT26_006642, partial [Gymnopilus dilepis]